MPLANRRVRNPATLTANVPTGVVQIIGSQRKFFLSEPIDLDVRRESGRWVVEYAPLKLSVAERSEEDTFAAFAEMFEVVWEHIGEAPDRELTGSARGLKAAFRHAVAPAQPTSS
jgi:hypothetical protein